MGTNNPETCECSTSSRNRCTEKSKCFVSFLTPDCSEMVSPAKDDEEIECVKQLPYLQLIGALLYLSTMSRPDISYHMSVLCSHMQNPILQCYEAAQSLLLYVGKTRHLSIRYSRNYTVPAALSTRAPHIRAQGGVCSFSDSTWTAPTSTCGYVVFMSGGPVAYTLHTN